MQHDTNSTHTKKAQRVAYYLESGVRPLIGLDLNLLHVFAKL